MKRQTTSWLVLTTWIATKNRQVWSYNTKLQMTIKPASSIGKAAERDAMLSAPLQTDVVTAPVTLTTLVLPASSQCLKTIGFSANQVQHTRQ